MSYALFFRPIQLLNSPNKSHIESSDESEAQLESDLV